MKEIGGYFELDRYRLPMLHEEALALNCGRNCLSYLIEARNIKKILLPYFMCNVVSDTCKKKHVDVRYYHIDEGFLPVFLDVKDGEWLYIANFYGQLSKDYLLSVVKEYKYVIIDNAHAYFEAPLENTDTIYTCRKFFGVADGAFLYTDAELQRELELDKSYSRMNFVLGRFEEEASVFYPESSLNNSNFANEPVKHMSLLTRNLLHGIDYEFVKCRRSDNFKCLSDAFHNVNRLNVRHVDGAYAYPLWVHDGDFIRKELLSHKIYIPILWPNVIKDVSDTFMEYDLAGNILPLPCDQGMTPVICN